MEALWITLGTFGLMVAPILYFARQFRRLQERMKRLRPRNSAFGQIARIRVTHPSTKDTQRKTSAILYVSNKHIVAYPVKGDETPLFTCLAHEIEGFWRPTKYQDGDNLMEIHANTDGQWSILKVTLPKSSMMALVRALKALVNEDIVRAYRQHRPYIYRPPSPAQLATQDLYGVWDHGTPFNVYLTPATLVFLREQDKVERVIKLRDIQNIRVIKPSDTEEGLVCFQITSASEDVAIAVEHADAWAQSIATAARRTLEDPISRKRKGKEDAIRLEEDIDVEDDAFDLALWESQEYILGDDGELAPRLERASKNQ